MPSNAHDFLKSLWRWLVGRIAFINGYCPECLTDLKDCNKSPCHVCNVLGYISPNQVWTRFKT